MLFFRTILHKAFQLFHQIKLFVYHYQVVLSSYLLFLLCYTWKCIVHQPLHSAPWKKTRSFHHLLLLIHLIHNLQILVYKTTIIQNRIIIKFIYLALVTIINIHVVYIYILITNCLWIVCLKFTVNLMLNIHLFLKVVHQISISISKILYSLVQLVHQLLLSITQILKHIVKQHFNYTISKFHKQVFQQHCILITIIHYFLLVLQTNIPCNHLTYINIKFLCIQIIFTHRIKATSSCH